MPEAGEALIDYYRRIAGEHDDWDEYLNAMSRERRVLLRLQLTEAGPARPG